MKKGLLSIMLLATFLGAAMADDYTYPYLRFVDSEGTQTTVSVNELEITFSEGQLVAKNSDGTATIPLASLAMMQFSETGTVSPVTPVKEKSGLALAGDTGELTATLGEEFNEPVLENPNALTLVWTSSDESVATVDNEGNVTLVGAGTAVITASFAGNDEYEAGSVNYTLIVNAPEEDAINTVLASKTVKVYTVEGVFIGRFDSIEQAQAVLKKGLYVVSTGNTNLKLYIR